MENKSLRAAYGAHVQHEYVKKKYALRHGINGSDGVTLPQKTIPSKREADGRSTDIPAGKICIIGAGAAGLAIALMLREKGFSKFDIFEASDRVGGRCYTFSFQEGDCPHDYYDIGAMRLPDIAAMKP